MYCSQRELSARKDVQKVLESLYKLLSGCKGIMIVVYKKYLIVGNSTWKIQCFEVINRWKMYFERQAHSNNAIQRGGNH